MKNKLTIQIAEGLGNQMFMYAFAYSLSKKFDYELYIDKQSGFSQKKNLLRSHQKFMLDNFHIEGKYATEKMIYDTNFKRFKKKIKLLLDNFSQKKNFLIEENKLFNKKKIAHDLNIIDKSNFSNNLYIQGNFENYNYFINNKNELQRIFTVKDEFLNKDNFLIDKIKNSNSISLHIRRNRFSDQKQLKTAANIKKSYVFTEDIINYINNSLEFINAKVSNPEYFIWTNDHNDINLLINKLKLKNYTLIKNNILNDFNLFKYCKHFIVGPSSFHWWGAWLNENPNKMCIRPKKINPSNNLKFWPNDWISV